MKNTAVVLSVIAILGSAVSGRASVNTGSGSELFLTGTAAAEYTDNLFLSSGSTKSDTLVTLTPGVLWQFGQGSDNVGRFSLSEDFQFYSSKSSLDTNLTNAAFLSRYDDGKMKFNTDASYNQYNQANRDLAGNGFLVRRNLSDLGVSTEFGVTDKSRIGIGAGYHDTDFSRPGFADLRYIEIPFKYFYEMSPKLDASAGIRYRNNQVGTGGSDSKEMFYSVGARGDLAPKLTGEVNVGYNQRKLDVGGTQNGLGLDSKFTYEATTKTSLMFGASNEFGYSSSGTSYKITGVNGSFETQVSGELKLNGGIYYSKYKYTGTRTDDFYQAQIGGSYLLNGFTTLRATYAYAKNDSNVSGSGFTSNTLTVAAVFKY